MHDVPFYLVPLLQGKEKHTQIRRRKKISRTPRVNSGADPSDPPQGPSHLPYPDKKGTILLLF
jgi:hypothetical protein